mmetsp:Transcript_7081/g.16023  ORF Transcript_7081/g.16023 Transcript_7081/m.16023 type:complete len:146 (-) Transcript_7081:1109-1546(-)
MQTCSSVMSGQRQKQCSPNTTSNGQLRDTNLQLKAKLTKAEVKRLQRNLSRLDNINVCSACSGSELQAAGCSYSTAFAGERDVNKVRFITDVIWKDASESRCCFKDINGLASEDAECGAQEAVPRGRSRLPYDGGILELQGLVQA